MSYSKDDKLMVRRVAEGLRKAGIRVWFDEDIKRGINWVREIERALNDADLTIVFVSPRLTSSDLAQQELNFIMFHQISGKRVRLLPILLTETDMPPLLRTIQYLHLRDGDADRAIKLLIDVIQKSRH